MQLVCMYACMHVCVCVCARVCVHAIKLLTIRAAPQEYPQGREARRRVEHPEKDVCDDANSPNVCLSIIFLLANHFGRDIPWCTMKLSISKEEPIWRASLCNAKVAQLERGFFARVGIEYILRFHVEMNDTFLMTMTEPNAHGADCIAGHGL